MGFVSILDSIVPHPSIVSLSLRDPAGSLFDVDGHLIRLVNKKALSQIEVSLKSPALRSLTEVGNFIETRPVEQEEESLLLKLFHEQSPSLTLDVGKMLQHKKVPFVSYPYEWPPEMLYAAAQLTLDLAEKLLDEGLGLKDATPNNILFVGPNPVFVDVLSVEDRGARDPIWRPYTQFARTFLNPLLANKYFGVSLGTLLPTHQDGLSSEEVYRFCGPLQRLSPSFLGPVTIPTWLSRIKPRVRQEAYQPRLLADEEQAKFVLKRLFKRLRRTLAHVCPSANKKPSVWCEYMERDLPYTHAQLLEKEKIILSVLDKFRPKAVLDVGCNNGHFSSLAARMGAKVVAVDSDPGVVGKAWRNAKEANLEILPLVVNLCYPSPSIGWMNREFPSFLKRAKGSFDAVFMLALIHHMMVGDGIPLPEVLRLSSELTTDLLVMEYVGRSDPMFQSLQRGRDHSHFTQEFFENETRRYFTTIQKQSLSGSDRCLYVFRKKSQECKSAKI
jgi:Methyltransferase domain